MTGQDGKQLDITARLDPAEHKFDTTSVLCSEGDGTKRLVSVELGGSTYTVGSSRGVHPDPSDFQIQ
jgi:hypothetical protein